MDLNIICEVNMDITNQFYLNRIKNSPNKNNRRIKNMIREINLQISGYRLEAMKSRGFIREYCNREANWLEKSLEFSMNQQKRAS